MTPNGKSGPRIVIVEDQAEQVNWLRQIVEETFRDPSILELHTESDFYAATRDFAEQVPDLILLDVMLRWADPSETIPDPPEEVRRERHYKAGFRCERLLRENPATREVPVILFSVAEKNDIAEEIEALGERTVFLSKSDEPEKLVRAMRRMLG